MDEQNDEALVAAYTAGDEQAFSTLIERYVNTVYSFVYRLVGDTREAEDITQESFVKIWKNAQKYDDSASKFKTWALRIARNTAIDHLRKRKHIPLSAFETADGANALAETIADPELLPDELFAEKEDVQALMRATEALSPKYREVLVLHYTNHLTFEEIARVLKEPHNTVKSRHRRALQALRLVFERRTQTS